TDRDCMAFLCQAPRGGRQHALTARGGRTYDCPGRRAAMSTTERYARPTGEEAWAAPGSFETAFRWEDGEGPDSRLRVYPQGHDLRGGPTCAHRLGARPRSRKPEGAAGGGGQHLRLGRLESDAPPGASHDAPPPAGVAALAVPPRRAGRARLHREDRPAGAERRREVLCRHPGDGRGATRRGLQASPARQVRARLSDHTDPE